MSAGTINLTHGGDLDLAARTFGIPREQWLDLSTGIAPWGWTVDAVPAEVWLRLPAVECPLREPSGRYYGCDPEAVLAIPGSQFAIQTLPTLLPPGRVALPALGYFEHRKAWQAAGHRLLDYDDNSLEQLEAKIRAGQLEAVVVINPNNPTATIIDKARLLRWSQLLARRGGHLIVDEAFMDSDGTQSLAPECPRPGLVVLRSLGKFFGLAGLRLGFVLAESGLQEQLQARLGPWAVGGPAQYVGAKALRDGVWQKRQRQRVRQTRSDQWQMLTETLAGGSDAIPCRLGLGPLFMSVFLPNTMARSLAERLAAQGIWVRRFVFTERQQGQLRQMGCLRFGLVKDGDQLQRLRIGINHCVMEL